MRTGVITASYLDPLAVRIESVRPGKAGGWRRFLVFAALTKGRKGSEYVALFTYFSFEGMEARMAMLNGMLMSPSLVTDRFRRRTSTGHQRSHTVFGLESETHPRRSTCAE